MKSLTIAFNSLSIVHKETLLYQQDIDKELSKTYSFKSEVTGRILCSIDIDYVMDKGTSYESFSFNLTEVVSRTEKN